MRLKEFQVKQICHKLVVALKNKQLLKLKASETEVLKKMEEVFIHELKIEDDINKEAQRLLEQYAEKMGDQIDRQKMFQMIKNQLVKDKKIVL